MFYDALSFSSVCLSVALGYLQQLRLGLWLVEWRSRVFLVGGVVGPLPTVKMTVVVKGLAVLPVVLGGLTVVVVVREVLMMEVLVMEWGYGQGSRDWPGCVVRFGRKKYHLPAV